MTELPPLSSDPDSAATAINDKGQVVGISGLCSNAVGGASAKHALIWEDGIPTDLGTLGGGAWRTPVAINNQGTVVGFANASGDEDAGLDPTAFIWTSATGMVPIPPIGSDTTDIAYDINNKNQVVGVSNFSRAFLFQNNQINDLNALVLQPTTLFLEIAQGINDSGEITGTALDISTGLQVGFLAVPVFNGSGTTAPSKAPAGSDLSKMISSETVRRQLKQLPGLPGFLFRAMGLK
jgi:probable HAF family extracellular repeat protein